MLGRGCAGIIDASPSFLGVMAFEAVADDEVHCALCTGRRLHDQTVILRQFAYPVLDVSGGVLLGVFRGDTDDCAKESGSGLRDQLFLAVELVSEAGSERPCKAAFVARAMHQFMKQSCVIVGDVDEAETRGKVYGVGHGPVVSAAFVDLLGANRWTSSPTADDGFAGVISVYRENGCWLDGRNG